jgi:shikimate kinase
MSIILIGMPGSGKSVIGEELSAKINKPFIDTDDLIVSFADKPVKDLIGENFLLVETNAIKTIPVDFDGVIATGGSVVYSEDAIQFLKTLGEIIYLDVSFEELEVRVGDIIERGVVIKENMTFKDLYDERKPLYEKYADVKILNANKDATLDALDIIYSTQKSL